MNRAKVVSFLVSLMPGLVYLYIFFVTLAVAQEFYPPAERKSNPFVVLMISMATAMVASALTLRSMKKTGSR